MSGYRQHAQYSGWTAEGHFRPIFPPFPPATRLHNMPSVDLSEAFQPPEYTAQPSRPISRNSSFQHALEQGDTRQRAGAYEYAREVERLSRSRASSPSFVTAVSRFTSRRNSIAMSLAESVSPVVPTVPDVSQHEKRKRHCLARLGSAIVRGCKHCCQLHGRGRRDSTDSESSDDSSTCSAHAHAAMFEKFSGVHQLAPGRDGRDSEGREVGIYVKEGSSRVGFRRVWVWDEDSTDY